MKLFVFGLGYSAGHYCAATTMWQAIAGTVRDPAKAATLRRQGLNAMTFNDDGHDPTIEAALADSDAILVSVQPGRAGDPVLRRFGAAIEHAPGRARMVYLSTVGVYGDHGGTWIDERTLPDPSSDRGQARLDVERAWTGLAKRCAGRVQILRLAGIYGPGRNALADLRAGEARRIVKPGQVFNRIHVTDIGRTIDRAFAHEGESAVWNVADDEPAAAPDVIDYAAKLMGVPPPPAIPFEAAELSPMARSFYAANRRIANRAIRQDLGVDLAYPTFRDGLDALWAAGEGGSDRG